MNKPALIHTLCIFSDLCPFERLLSSPSHTGLASMQGIDTSGKKQFVHGQGGALLLRLFFKK